MDLLSGGTLKPATDAALKSAGEQAESWFVRFCNATDWTCFQAASLLSGRSGCELKWNLVSLEFFRVEIARRTLVEIRTLPAVATPPEPAIRCQERPCLRMSQ